MVVAAKSSPYRANNAFNTCTFTFGVEGSNTRNVAVQLKSARGVAIGEKVACRVWLSDHASDGSITATAVTTALAIGTNGKLLNIPVTDKMVDVVSDASGRFDIDVVQTAAHTYYVCVQMPDGSIVVSSALAFA